MFAITLFKPSEARSGNRTIVQIDRSPCSYAEIKRDNGNILFRIVDESDTFDSGYVCTMKMWGIKLDGINTGEITHKTTETLEHYLDNLDSDQVYFNSGLEDTENLVVNGDFSDGTTNWLSVNPSNMPLTVSNNILSFTATEQYGAVYFVFTPTINQEYYFSASVKTDSKLVGIYSRFAPLPRNK